MDTNTPPSKPTLLRRLKGWLGSKEKPTTPDATEKPVQEALIEMPANPVEAVLTPELPPVNAVMEQTAHTQKSPVAAPKATRKTRAAQPKEHKEPATKEKKPLFKPHAKSDLLAIFPIEANLIGRAPVEVTLDGEKHVLAFRNEHIILDGHNYHVIKSSVALDIEDVKRIGTHLDVVIGAFGKTETLTFEADDVEHMLATLLTHGTYKNEKEDLVITRF